METNIKLNTPKLSADNLAPACNAAPILPLAEQVRKLTELQHNIQAANVASNQELVIGYMVGNNFRPLLAKAHSGALDETITTSVLDYLAQRQQQVVTILAGLGIEVSDDLIGGSEDG
jgi:hypothetical protein